VTTYTISSTVGGSTPTSITFTPGLVAQPVADNAVVKNSWTGGAVNNGAGYTTTTTAIAVDGLAHAIPNGSTVKFSGHATIYTISSSTGGATPTAVTLGSGLTSAVVDNETFTIYPRRGRQQARHHDARSREIPRSRSMASRPRSRRGTTSRSRDRPRPITVVSTVGGRPRPASRSRPALATAAGIPVDNAVVTIQAQRLRSSVGEGNLTYEEKRNMTYVREKRSMVDGFVMTGDDEPVDVSLDLIWEYLAADVGRSADRRGGVRTRSVPPVRGSRRGPTSANPTASTSRSSTRPHAPA
jgi:hypothetical protein